MQFKLSQKNPKEMGYIWKVRHKRKSLLVDKLFISNEFVVYFFPNSASTINCIPAPEKIRDFWLNEFNDIKSEYIFKKLGTVEQWLTAKNEFNRKWARKIIELRDNLNKEIKS